MKNVNISKKLHLILNILQCHHWSPAVSVQTAMNVAVSAHTHTHTHESGM